MFAIDGTNRCATAESVSQESIEMVSRKLFGLIARHHAIRFIGIAMLITSSTLHAKNPGESAMDCLEVKGSSDKVTFRNHCGGRIFVIWCGELKYSKKRCGDGPKKAGNGVATAGFYTHSFNMDAATEREETIAGEYRYAACKGGISFGNDGEYRDDADGSFVCQKR